MLTNFYVMSCLMTIFVLATVVTRTDGIINIDYSEFEFTSIDIMCDAIRQLRHNITNVANDVTTIKHAVEAQGTHLYPSCRAILESDASFGTGWYWIKPTETAVPVNVYCDQESGTGGWMRLFYKEGPNTCFHNREVTWTPQHVESLGLSSNGVDFAVSEDPQTVATTLSWVLWNVSWSGPHVSTRLANLLSCRTPTGTNWSQGYQDGYLHVTGALGTFGGFTSMHYGCRRRANLGENLSLRTGGRARHTGEFIHSACNDYHVNRDNAVTSRWNSANTRALWVRI